MLSKPGSIFAHGYLKRGFGFVLYPRIDRGSMIPGYVAIWHGLPSNRSMFAIEPKNLVDQRGKRPRLHPFEKLNIICSLSYAVRIKLLQSSDAPSLRTEGKEEGHDSVTSEESSEHPDQTLDAIQFSLEEDIVNEIRTYLSPSPGFNNIVLEELHINHFSVHFPCLETVIRYLIDSHGSPSRVLELLRVVIAATSPQRKRQLARSFMVPSCQRRSQLKAFLSRRVKPILKGKGYGPEYLKEFDIITKAKHSSFNSRKRDTGGLIEERNREFVKVSMNEYRKGRQTSKNMVVGTTMCTEAEWDARFAELEKTRVGLKRNVTKAMQKRGKMSTLTMKE
jgi:hypothetical protein